MMLGNEYSRKRDFRAALPHYKRALAHQARVRPRDHQSREHLSARSARTKRRCSDTSSTCRRDPKNAHVRYQMGELFVDLGRLDEADSAFRQALSDDTRWPRRATRSASSRCRRGDMRRAEQEIRAALAEKPDVRLAHFNLALVAEAARRPAEGAPTEDQKEIDTRPTLQGRLQPGQAVRADGGRGGAGGRVSEERSS